MIKTITLIFTLSFSLSAQNEWLDNIDLYLHTVDRGTMVYDNFGHTAVRVHNKNTGEDLVYNWGIFDFREPDFVLNFYRGILTYTLGAYPIENALAQYKREKRTVWEDKINFSRNEKLIFLKKLEQNIKPDNRDYSYQYFSNNCSTIVRDYFNEATSGIVQKHFEAKMSGRAFRDTIEAAYKTNPEIHLALDFLMNSNIDREMTEWQEMFLPLKFREHLLKLQIDRPFISESKILVEFPAAKPRALNGFHIFAIISALLIAGLIFSDFKQKEKLKKVFWGLTLLPLLLLGVLGLMMLSNWLFSGHSDFKHNYNMLIIWPIDIILLWPVLMLIIKGADYNPKGKSQKLWSLFIKAHFILAGIYYLGWIFRITSQGVGNTALFIVPFYLVFLALLSKTFSGRESIRLGYGIN